MSERTGTRQRYGGILAAFLICTSFPAIAHEFWIAPLEYSTVAGGQIAADLRVGQDFDGAQLSYQPDRVEAATLIGPDGTKQVDGDVGATPALRTGAMKDGLHILTYVSAPSVTAYNSFEEFEGFVHEEGLDDALTRHRDRGLPERGFREAFTRYAKTLVSAGRGGEDSATGMRLELVARTNPYDGAVAQRVTLLFEGAPLEGAQVSVFAKDADDEVTVSRLRTDHEGEIGFSVIPGYEYMLNAVRLVEPGRALVAREQVLWHSLWASLTFRAPS